ncbi:MAG TPA: hypothetical protein VJK05_01695 [archaeon]|nr:hypothetical protein [archaeon]
MAEEGLREMQEAVQEEEAEEEAQERDLERAQEESLQGNSEKHGGTLLKEWVIIKKKEQFLRKK